MKFDVSGVPKTVRDRRPGTLLGEKRVTCARCDREYLESQLSVVPPDAAPGTSRIYVCTDCK